MPIFHQFVPPKTNQKAKNELNFEFRGNWNIKLEQRTANKNQEQEKYF
jgi:hypothetical protein